MKLYEVLVMGSTLVLCALGVIWLLKDLYRQIETYEERCESSEDNKEE